MKVTVLGTSTETIENTTESIGSIQFSPRAKRLADWQKAESRPRYAKATYNEWLKQDGPYGTDCDGDYVDYDLPF